MRLFLAVLFGKILNRLTKFFRIGGGSAAPGLYALEICPDLVKQLSKQIPKNIIVTGTNGKTTTAKMLSHFAIASGLKVIRNHTGSNLERGIASTLIQNSHLHLQGIRTNYDLGIWELDEAAFNIVAPHLNPDTIIFLNVFRDQLDRYGEVDTVVKKWRQTLKNLGPKTQILINGDDLNTVKLVEEFKGKVQKFGIKNHKITGEVINQPKKPVVLDIEATDIKLNGLNSSTFQLTINNDLLTINLPLPGIYHIYDFIASFTGGLNLGLNPKQMIASLKDYSPAFGRVEKLPFGYIFLIKNPIGATQVFETIAPNIKPADRLLLALNDNTADGKDVSWIWDVNFESFQNSSRVKPRDYTIYVSGSRAYDLANRLKYAGFSTESLTIQPDLQQALKQARAGLKGQLLILPTYTAMLELQSILTHEGIKKHYWKEEE